jgi:tripartite-type tricarboxylate transporter receptor subunit TctC
MHVTTTSSFDERPCIGKVASRFLACVLLVLSCHVSNAAEWPERPIRFIVSQAAGSPPDVICRIITDAIGKNLGQQVIVENRPGGGNIIGTQAAARSEPDGYTFFFGTSAALVSNPYTYKTLPYDPLKDFSAISMVVKGPFVLVVDPDLPIHSLSDVFKYQKANPGRLQIASDGARNFSGILAAWLSKLGGADIVQVPFPNIAQASQEILAKRIPLGILAISQAAPHIASGKMRALAVSSAKPMPKFESIRPMAETFPGLDFVGWFVLVAPAGTPTAIVDKMNLEMQRVLKDPAVVNRFVDIGFFTEGAGTPAETQAFIRDEYAVWGKILGSIGLQPQ